MLAPTLQKGTTVLPAANQQPTSLFPSTSRPPLAKLQVFFRSRAKIPPKRLVCFRSNHNRLSSRLCSTKIHFLEYHRTIQRQEVCFLALNLSQSHRRQVPSSLTIRHLDLDSPANSCSRFSKLKRRRFLLRTRATKLNSKI